MGRFQKLSIAAGILSISLAAKSWAVTTINFDPPSGGGDLPASLTAMSNSPGSSVPSSAQLSDQYRADGVLFSSTDPFVAVVAATSPNGIGGVTGSGLLSYADPVIFTFVVPGTSTPGVTNDVSIQADASGIPGQFATLRAFDIDGNLIDIVTLNDIGSEVWNINLAGVHSARFDFPTTSDGTLTTGSAFGNGTGIALDNLIFGPVTQAPSSGPGPSAVPLPAMVWDSLILLGGLAGVGALRRRAIRA